MGAVRPGEAVEAVLEDLEAEVILAAAAQEEAGDHESTLEFIR